jgi:hypothetical protein
MTFIIMFYISLSKISLTSLTLVFIAMDLLAFEESLCLVFSHFMCFWIGICMLEAKLLFGSFNHL